MQFFASAFKTYCLTQTFLFTRSDTRTEFKVGAAADTRLFITFHTIIWNFVFLIIKTCNWKSCCLQTKCNFIPTNDASFTFNNLSSNFMEKCIPVMVCSNQKHLTKAIRKSWKNLVSRKSGFPPSACANRRQEIYLVLFSKICWNTLQENPDVMKLSPHYGNFSEDGFNTIDYNVGKFTDAKPSSFFRKKNW